MNEDKNNKNSIDSMIDNTFSHEINGNKADEPSTKEINGNLKNPPKPNNPSHQNRHGQNDNRNFKGPKNRNDNDGATQNPPHNPNAKNHNKNNRPHANNQRHFSGRNFSAIAENEKFASTPNFPDNVKDGVRSINTIDEKSNLGFHKDLKVGVEANEHIYQASIDIDSKLNLSTKAVVRITPLGGLGEIGGNITVIETEKSAIVVDVGMSFPDETMHGVDILIPDFSYLHAIKDKIVGVLITHAHEDHIGAVPYLYKQLQFPLYGTPLPLGMIGAKFDEHGLKKCREHFRIVEKRVPIKIGDFEVEWIHITHSVIDASALAITTEAGTILHTGDFKIDHTPMDNMPTDLHRLAYYGEKGVMLMLSDSTNSHRLGSTASEMSVGPTFDSLFKSSSGRVIMSTFSSNVHRIYQAITYGIKYNRKVAVIGRSMEKNLDIAMELGYIKLPRGIFIEAHEVEKYPDNEILVVTTGSQGETQSALYRMATNEHRHISIKPDDMIIISAKAIPGNEGNVSAVMNFLIKAGAKVAYQDFSEIHVSGHAAQEEQKLMLRLIKPKFFLPVHGEYNHLAKHKETAIKCGVDERNIYLMEDGDQIEVNPNYMKKVRSVKNGKLCIDNQINRLVEHDIIIDRQNLADGGIVVLNADISKDKKIRSAKIRSYGLVADKEDAGFEKKMNEQLELLLTSYKKERLDAHELEKEIEDNYRKYIFKMVKKYPLLDISVHIS